MSVSSTNMVQNSKNFLINTACTTGVGLLGHCLTPVPIKECLALGATTSILAAACHAAFRKDGYDEYENLKKTAITCMVVATILLVNYCLAPQIKTFVGLEIPIRSAGVVLVCNALGQMISFPIEKEVKKWIYSSQRIYSPQISQTEYYNNTNKGNPDPSDWDLNPYQLHVIRVALFDLKNGNKNPQVTLGSMKEPLKKYLEDLIESCLKGDNIGVEESKVLEEIKRSVITLESPYSSEKERKEAIIGLDAEMKHLSKLICGSGNNLPLYHDLCMEEKL